MQELENGERRVRRGGLPRCQWIYNCSLMQREGSNHDKCDQPVQVCQEQLE